MSTLIENSKIANHADPKDTRHKSVAPSLCGGRTHFFPPQYVEFVDHNVRDSLEKSALLLIHFGYAESYVDDSVSKQTLKGVENDAQNDSTDSGASKTAETRSRIQKICTREIGSDSQGNADVKDDAAVVRADETASSRVELFHGLTVPLLKPIEPFAGSQALTAALRGIYGDAGFAWCASDPSSVEQCDNHATDAAAAAATISPPLTGREEAAARFEKGVEAILEMRQKCGSLRFDSLLSADEELADRVESFVVISKGCLRRCQSSSYIPMYIRKYLIPLLFSWAVDWSFAQRSTSLWKAVVNAFVQCVHTGKLLRGGNAVTFPWRPLLSMLETSGEKDVNDRYSGHSAVRLLCRTAAPYLEADAFVHIWAFIAPQLSLSSSNFGWSVNELRLFLPSLRLKSKAEKDILRQIVDLLLNASIAADSSVEKINQCDVWSFLQAGLQRSKGDLDLVESLAETLFTCYLRVLTLRAYVVKGSLEKCGPQHWIRRANNFLGEALPQNTDSPFWNQLKRFLRWVEQTQDNPWKRQMFSAFVKDVTQAVQKRLYWQRAKTRKQQGAEDDDAAEEDGKEHNNNNNGGDSVQNKMKEEILKKVQEAKHSTGDENDDGNAVGPEANFAETYDVAVAFYEDTDEDDGGDDSREEESDAQASAASKDDEKTASDVKTSLEAAERVQRQVDWTDETCAAFVDLLAPMLLPALYVTRSPRAALARSLETLITIHPTKTLQHILPYLLEGFKAESTGDMFMVSLRLLQMTMTMTRGREGRSNGDESNITDVDRLWDCIVDIIPTLPERMSANNADQFQLIAQSISQFSAFFPFSSLFHRKDAEMGSDGTDQRAVGAEIEFVTVLMDNIESVCQDSSTVKSNRFGSMFGFMQTWFEAMRPEALQRCTERVCRLVRTLGTPAQAKLTQYLVYQAVAAAPARMLSQILPGLRDNIVHRSASLTVSALRTEKDEMGWDVTMMCAAVRGGGAASFAFRHVVVECVDALMRNMCKDVSADHASKLFAALCSSTAVRAAGVGQREANTGVAATDANGDEQQKEVKSNSHPPLGTSYTPGEFCVQWSRPTHAHFEFLVDLHDRLVYDTFTRIRAIFSKPSTQEAQKQQQQPPHHGTNAIEGAIDIVALREHLQFVETIESVSTSLHEARSYLSEGSWRTPMEAIRTFSASESDGLNTSISFRGQITCPSMDAVFLTLAGLESKSHQNGARSSVSGDNKALEPCTRSAIQRFLIHEVVPQLLDDDGLARFHAISGVLPTTPKSTSAVGSTRYTDQRCKAACLQTIGFLVQSARQIQLPYQFMDVSTSAHWKRLAHTVMVKEDGMPAAFWLHGSRAAIHFAAGPRVQPIVSPTDFTEALYVTLGFSGATNVKDMVKNSQLLYKSLYGLSSEGVRVWCKSRHGLLTGIAQSVREAAEQQQQLLGNAGEGKVHDPTTASPTSTMNGNSPKEELTRVPQASKDRSTAVKLGTNKIIESVVKSLTSLATMAVLAWSHKQLDATEDFVNVLLAVPDEYLDNTQFLVIKTIIQHTGTVLRQVPISSSRALALAERLIAVAGVMVSKAVPRATSWLNFAYDVYTPSSDLFLSASAVRTLFRLAEYSHAELHKKALLFLNVAIRPSEKVDKQWVIRMLPEDVAWPWGSSSSCTSAESVVQAASEGQFFSKPSAASIDCYYKEYTRLTRAWPDVDIIGEWRCAFPPPYLHVIPPQKGSHLRWKANADDGTVEVGGETFKLMVPAIPSYPQLMDPRESKPPLWCFSTAEQADVSEPVEDDKVVSLRHAINVASGCDMLHTKSPAVVKYAARIREAGDKPTSPQTSLSTAPDVDATSTEIMGSWLYKMADNFDFPAFNDANVCTLQHLCTSLSVETFAPVVLATADVLIARLEGAGLPTSIPRNDIAVVDAAEVASKLKTPALTTDEQTHVYGAVMEFLVSILSAEGKCPPARALAMSKLLAMCLFACRSSSPNGVLAACTDAVCTVCTELRWYEAEELFIGLCSAFATSTASAGNSYALCGTIEQCRALSLVTRTVPLLRAGALVHVLPKLLDDIRTNLRHLLDTESTLVQVTAGRCIHSILKLCLAMEPLYDPTGEIVRTSVEIARDILKNCTLPVYETSAGVGRDSDDSGAHASAKQHHLNRGYALLASLRAIPFRFLCLSLDNTSETPSEKLASIALHSNAKSSTGASNGTSAVTQHFLLSTCLLLFTHDVNCEYEELKSLQRAADLAIMDQGCQFVPKDVCLDAMDSLCDVLLSGVVPIDLFPAGKDKEEELEGTKKTAEVPAGRNAYASIGDALLLLVKLNYNRLGKYARFVKLFDASLALLRHVDTDAQQRGRKLAELLTAAASGEQMMELTKRYQITLTTRSKQVKELRCERQASALLPSSSTSPSPTQSQIGELERDRQALAAVLGASLCVAQPRLPLYAPRVMRCLLQLSDDSNALLSRIVRSVLGEWWRHHHLLIAFSHKDDFSTEVLERLKQVCFSQQYLA